MIQLNYTPPFNFTGFT